MQVVAMFEVGKTYNDMRNEIVKLNMLRTHLSRSVERYKKEIAELKAENEKLRLLVRGLDYCSDELSSAECDKCPLHDPSDPNLEPKCVRMMRDLGIDKEEL